MEKDIRIEKYKSLMGTGYNPYPSKSEKKIDIIKIKDIEIQEEHNPDANETVSVAGRLVSKRGHGKSCFAHVKDSSGKIQVYFRKDVLNEAFDLIKSIDIGDILDIKGPIFVTNTGETTVLVKSYRLISKSINPYPEKWHGLKDIELRHRLRYLDLIVNEDVKEIFIKRSKIISYFRSFLNEKGFLEVETPIMQPIAGGANAEPFKTHHNALDMALYMRVAPELYLKRLITGGFEKIYEIGKAFRNEGLSLKHNPEFTLFELYQAYADYEDMMILTEEIMKGLVNEIFSSYTVELNGTTIDFSKPFRRMTFFDSLKDVPDFSTELLETETLDTLIKKYELGDEKINTKTELLLGLFDKYIEPELIQPTFIYDYPAECSPLAKRKEDNEDIAERFEFFITGQEIGNAYSEQNNPFIQLNNFKKQIDIKRTHGDEESEIDYDYINALEYGMPPTGGLGLGIDRIVMLLTGTDSIREVLFFPLLRPNPEIYESIIE